MSDMFEDTKKAVTAFGLTLLFIGLTIWALPGFVTLEDAEFVYGVKSIGIVAAYIGYMFLSTVSFSLILDKVSLLVLYKNHRHFNRSPWRLLNAVIIAIVTVLVLGELGIVSKANTSREMLIILGLLLEAVIAIQISLGVFNSFDRKLKVEHNNYVERREKLSDEEMKEMVEKEASGL